MVVTVTASLVPKVQEEKGVPSVCCMCVCTYISQILEICVTVNSKQWLTTSLHTHYLSCVGVVGIMLVTMSVYVPKTSQLPPHSLQNLLVQYIEGLRTVRAVHRGRVELLTRYE